MKRNSRAKRWPTVANRHRTEAIMEAAEIEQILREAKNALRKRNLDLCLALISGAESKAQLVKMWLETAPGAEGNGTGDG